jgi:hypothetical protein
MMLAQPQSARDTETKVITQFNSLLVNRTTAFRKANSDVRAVVVDDFIVLDRSLDHPEIWNVKNATCYSTNQEECLWYNDYHIGPALQFMVAQIAAGTWRDGKILNGPAGTLF